MTLYSEGMEARIVVPRRCSPFEYCTRRMQRRDRRAGITRSSNGESGYTRSEKWMASLDCSNAEISTIVHSKRCQSSRK